MRLSREELLALHRDLVATPSVSGDEAAIVALLAVFLQDHGATVEQVGGSLVAWAGKAPAVRDVAGVPLVVLNTHVDTVPPAPGWTGEPYRGASKAGKVFGLGANDAKASVAAMTAALLAVSGVDLPFALALMLVRGEETKSLGTAEVVEELARRGIAPAMAVVGEPTGLDLAVAQKGLLVVELVARGEAAHAAHAKTLGAKNAVVSLARDLVTLAELPDGPLDPYLGRATVEPTVLSGGTARNVVPAEARAVLDCRTVPAEPPHALLARLRDAVSSELVVLSDRLVPVATDPASALVAAALRARPGARIYGSATLSDLTFFRGIPAVKVGPGESERSHRPDEFVLEQEIVDGAAFYESLLLELAAGMGATAPGRVGLR
ncbi:MAG: M20/M25/M40 family metallo-hydrolase [Thermoanaerobaculia bacterium]